MSYVDSTYYKESFGGTILQEDSLNRKLERASDQVDTLTYNRIVGIGFDNLKAICIHAEFIEHYGEYIDTPLSGFSAGSTSVSFNTNKVNGITTTQEVLNYLKQTGLTCRRL